MSGKVPVNYRDQDLFIGVPTIHQKLKAEEIYQRTYYESIFNDTIHEDDILTFIVHQGFWTQEDADNLVKAEADIETFKVELYNSVFSSNTERHVRKMLTMAKAEHARLYHKRHQYDFLTPKGIANLARTSYLVAASTTDVDGNHIINDYFSAPMSLVNYLVEQYNEARLDECELRFLARNEPWRSYWNAGKKEGQLFGISPIDYSEDQRLLVLWSSLYDSIYDSAESPSDVIIDDDDMLDGWLIVQRRRSEAEKIKRRGEKTLTNSKIKDASEVFIMAETYKDAKKVDTLNDYGGVMRKKSKFDAIKQFGTVAEADIPDVKRDLQMRLNQMAIDRHKRG